MRGRSNVFRDIGIIFLSVLIAVILVKTEALVSFLRLAPPELKAAQSFIAGIFFTSAFTTAPAIVVLAEITKGYSIFATAFFGALGALLGDLIIFQFIRDFLAEDFLRLLNKRGRERWKHLFRAKTIRWITPLIAGLIIASPLPDELGLMVMGFSRLKTGRFALFSFSANFIGIFIIGTIANSL